jgi:hypothetical protein
MRGFVLEGARGSLYRREVGIPRIVPAFVQVPLKGF